MMLGNENAYTIISLLFFLQKYTCTCDDDYDVNDNDNNIDRPIVLQKKRRAREASTVESKII
jgi:hypothetical protein